MMFFKKTKRIEELERALIHQKQISYDVVANTSHEIRTPLAAIVAIVDNLTDGVTQFSPSVGEQILELTERMNNTISFLLDLSMLDAGTQKLNYTTEEIGDYFFSIIEPLQMFEAHKNLRFTIDVTPEDLQFSFDKHRLSQALTNLITNAIRHANDNSEIIVRAYLEDRNLIITVFNEGKPIIEDNIFKRFETSAISRQTGGTGLGLTIAKWVVELHGGEICVVEPSDYGYTEVGACFKIWLPSESPSVMSNLHISTHK